MKHIILKSLILGFINYAIHMLIFWVFSALTKQQFGYYGFVGGILYGLIFGFWIYWALSAMYIYVSKNNNRRRERYAKGLFIICIGYILSRIPDIIDGDFMNNFSLKSLIFFFLLLPVMVEVEYLLRKSLKKN